jgi:hypothetical protein
MVNRAVLQITPLGQQTATYCIYSSKDTRLLQTIQGTKKKRNEVKNMSLRQNLICIPHYGDTYKQRRIVLRNREVAFITHCHMAMAELGNLHI